MARIKLTTVKLDITQAAPAMFVKEQTSLKVHLTPNSFIKLNESAYCLK